MAASKWGKRLKKKGEDKIQMAQDRETVYGLPGGDKKRAPWEEKSTMAWSVWERV